LQNLGSNAEDAAAGVKRLEDGAGEADSILQGLAGALDTVSPQLAGMVRVAG
jgi:X-X-X-Leu-X-X-Gly heptad repeat protein